MVKFPEPTILGQNYDGSDILAYTATDVAEYATVYTTALTRIIERKDADIEKLMERRDYWIDMATDLGRENRELRAILSEVHSWAVCSAIATPEDIMQNMPRIIEITAP